MSPVMPNCSDCHGPIETMDQLLLSLVAFEDPRCRSCFEVAKLVHPDPYDDDGR